jgi:hypothetical protein
VLESEPESDRGAATCGRQREASHGDHRPIAEDATDHGGQHSAAKQHRDGVEPELSGTRSVKQPTHSDAHKYTSTSQETNLYSGTKHKMSCADALHPQALCSFPLGSVSLFGTRCWRQVEILVCFCWSFMDFIHTHPSSK